MNALNPTMGQVIARAWFDARFKERLLANPKDALSQMKLAIPEGKTVVAVENTSRITHIVLTSPRYTETKSAYSDIKEFGESYRDPRLFPLNWGSHDPVFTARMKADPVKALGYMDVEVPADITIVVVENTRELAHLVLLVRPADLNQSTELVDKISAGHIPPALRYSALFGSTGYAQFT